MAVSQVGLSTDIIAFIKTELNCICPSPAPRSLTIAGLVLGKRATSLRHPSPILFYFIFFVLFRQSRWHQFERCDLLPERPLADAWRILMCRFLFYSHFLFSPLSFLRGPPIISLSFFFSLSFLNFLRAVGKIRLNVEKDQEASSGSKAAAADGPSRTIASGYLPIHSVPELQKKWKNPDERRARSSFQFFWSVLFFFDFISWRSVAESFPTAGYA